MYDLIKNYSTILFNRNLKWLGTELTVTDIINEVYATGFYTEEDVIKIIRDIVFKEKRRLIANRQIENKNGEKICNKCHNPKSYSEFYKRFDNRTGLHYLTNNCMECEKIRRFEYNSRKRKENEKNENI